MKVRLADETGAEQYALEVRNLEGELEIVLGTERHAVGMLEHTGTRLSFVLDGQVHRAHVLVTDAEVAVVLAGAEMRFRRISREGGNRGGASQGEGPAADPLIRAVVPGKVLKIATQAGNRVSAGDPLLVIEAMKMEHAVLAETNGTVQAVHVSEGEMVKVGSLLITCDWQATQPAG